MSPHPESAMPSTPRSASPKSFRLSDEEQSIASDSGSQAIQSSSGDENEGATESPSKDEAMPQLVMPSISMPARRPFTENGKRVGRLKIMIVGPQGVGKTSLIQSICRVCEDVVHMDPISGSSGLLDSPNSHGRFFDRIVDGMSDDHDIRTLCNLMLSRLSDLDADETKRRLPALAESFRKVLDQKPKEMAHSVR